MSSRVPLSALPVPTLLLDAEGCVEAASLLACEALGRSERRLAGSSWLSLFAPAGEGEAMLARLGEGVPVVTSHRMCLRGTGMPVSLHLGRREGGLVLMFVMEAHRREVEEHARRTELAEAAARIALELAHEVKNPLAAIRGATQWLRSRSPDVETAEALARIEDGTSRIRERIDAFLQLGPRADVEMEPVNVHGLILEVCEPVSGIELRRVFDPSLPRVRAHRARLKQALENLWRNAVEAKPGFIEWQTRLVPDARLPGRDAPVIEIAITNDGEPVPESIRERLFVPYVTGKERGSGLGLALVERVALEHGGRVLLDAGRKRTRVAIQLPAERGTTCSR